ncbi:MAG: TlpA family protein disulfide reductase [Deltaproteobacteria bacterium]|nr:TlpA family protein disulfide reductase [Nannocystaceae bacterium]
MLLGIAAASVIGCGRRRDTSVPTAASDGTIVLSDDGVAFAQRIAGQVAVVDFWATWCEPCRVSIPKVVSFAAQHERELVVVGVHVGHGFDEARAFASEAGMGYPLYADPEYALSGKLGAMRVPAIVVLDRKGVAVCHAGEIDDTVERAVRGALSSRS